MVPVLAARAAAVVMVGVAAFQVALVLGAPWGAYTQGGETEGALDTSGRVLAAVSCAILLVMAAAILARVREGPLKGASGKLVTALAWFTTIYVGVGARCVRADGGPSVRPRRDRNDRLSPRSVVRLATGVPPALPIRSPITPTKGL
jgi:hypothetical protein